MKKAFTIALLLGSLVIILHNFQFGEAITMFLLAGLIPGTDIIVSPNDMFTAIALITGFTLARLLTPSLRRVTTMKLIKN